MEQIKQTTLTVQDITEHHDMLDKLPQDEMGTDGQNGWIISYDMSQDTMDDMVYRFVMTFIE